VTASGRYAWIGGSNTEIFGSVKGVTYQYRNNDRLQDGTHVIPTVGIQTLLAERATLLVEVGASLRTYSNEFAPSYNDEEVSTPEANVALSWPIDEQASLMVRGYSSSDNGQSSNAYQILGAGTSGSYVLMDRLKTFASFDLLKIRDTAAAAGNEVSQRATTIGALGAQYEAVRGLAFRLTGRTTSSHDQVGTADYRTNEVTLDTAMAF